MNILDKLDEMEKANREWPDDTVLVKFKNLRALIDVARAAKDIVEGTWKHTCGKKYEYCCCDTHPIRKALERLEQGK